MMNVKPTYLAVLDRMVEAQQTFEIKATPSQPFHSLVLQEFAVVLEKSADSIALGHIDEMEKTLQDLAKRVSRGPARNATRYILDAAQAIQRKKKE